MIETGIIAGGRGATVPDGKGEFESEGFLCVLVADADGE